MINIPLLCSAILVFLYMGLSYNVSRLRLKNGKTRDVSPQDMEKAVRAHGNAAEYIPLFVALFLYLYPMPFNGMMSSVIDLNSPPAMPLSFGLMELATASRILHAAGMLFCQSLTQKDWRRFWGALGTYVALGGFGVLLLLRAL